MTEICRKKHHRWLVTRLAYTGLGNYKQVYFKVWAHATTREEAENDIICIRTRQGFEPVATMKECFVEPVRIIRRGD
jgi:hypothetical protein